MDNLTFIFSAIFDYTKTTMETRIFDLNAFVLFCPLVLLEIARYCLPVPILLILRHFKLDNIHEKEDAEFMKTNPFVSIVVAARNEQACIKTTIESLLALEYKNYEIIIVDDSSTDSTYSICKEFADKGLIRFFRNNEAAGRTGRPIATNFGISMANGEFIISLDADTSYDYDIIQRIIGPFRDPNVGVVAGNLKVSNINDSIWTVCQAIEYAISIGMWKRWTNVTHTTLQASGAFGAFRMETIRSFRGWDPELAEDADVSVKARKSGWDIAFAPYAIAMTNVPVKLISLIKQRRRWDKGTVRTYYHKHRDLMIPKSIGSIPFSIEVMLDFFLFYVLSFGYFFYFIVLLIVDWRLLIFMEVFCYFVYTFMTYCTMTASIIMSERRREEWFLLLYIPFFPIYKFIFRWVRIYANFQETFRLSYKENYLPESGYQGERW